MPIMTVLWTLLNAGGAADDAPKQPLIDAGWWTGPPGWQPWVDYSESFTLGPVRDDNTLPTGPRRDSSPVAPQA